MNNNNLQDDYRNWIGPRSPVRRDENLLLAYRVHFCKTESRVLRTYARTFRNARAASPIERKRNLRYKDIESKENRRNFLHHVFAQYRVARGSNVQRFSSIDKYVRSQNTRFFEHFRYSGRVSRPFPGIGTNDSRALANRLA